MASYVLDGYATPEGVDSRKKVKEYQEQLGVTVDGVWGPKTQAAYEAAYGATAQSQSRYGSSGQSDDGYGEQRRSYGSSQQSGTDSASFGSLPQQEVFQGGALYGGYGSYYTLVPAELDDFETYYEKAAAMIGTPEVGIDTPSRAEIQADAETVLRPPVDRAIKSRREEGAANMAELDADAASRGMGASTYVTSMKGREMSNTEEDVAMLESEYAASLADRVASYLQYYTNLNLQAQIANAEFSANAQDAVTTLASEWYDAYLAANEAMYAAAEKVAIPTQSGATQSGATQSGAKKSSVAKPAETEPAETESAGKSSGKSSGKSTKEKEAEETKEDENTFTMTADDYVKLVKNMSASERLKLYNSDELVWEESRRELYDALGSKRYAELEKTANPFIERGGALGG